MPPTAAAAAAAATTRPKTRLVRVWDLPTRLFHWALAASVIGLVITGQVAGNALEWHMRLGVGVGGLLLFRVLWGVVGGRWSRFSSFIFSPAACWRYLRGRPLPGDRFEVGHNPLGGLSVLAMLLLLMAQVGTGLVADDEIASTGPLNAMVSHASARLATAWHTGPGKLALLALVLLHLGAIAYHHWRRRQALVRAMLSGDKSLPPDTPASRDNLPLRLLAGVLALACAAGAYWVYQQGQVSF
jgi:cytochrome b